MIEITIDPTPISFIQEVELEGKVYRLEFRWNAREGCWYLTMKTSEDAVILGSRKMVVGTPLLRQTVDIDARPFGELVLVDPSDTIDTPGREELGNQVRLVYITEAELAAL